MRYWLLMPAAGSGRRFGGAEPKQYLPLRGARVIEHALAPFLADDACIGIFIALAEADALFSTLSAARDPRIHRVTGGARRCDSVRAALTAVPGDESDWVLVHDAARPCVTRSDVRHLIEAVGEDAIGGLLAAPVADTLKRAASDGPPVQALRVAETASREGLWRALTPQMFRLGLLREALAAAQQCGREPTDEAQAIEWLGRAPQLVQGDAGNIKITTPADLKLAAAWLQREQAA